MAGAGYKNFTSGDVLTASQVNTYLMDQAVMLFATAAARTSALLAPSEGMVSYLSDSNSVEVYDGADWKRVVRSTGSILQVVYGSTSTSASNSTTTFADTNLTATITPYATSSKILVLVSQNGVIKSSGNANNAVAVRLMRDATQIALSASLGFTGTLLDNRVTCSFGVLDSPATTAATTYKTQFRNDFAAASVTINGASSVSTIALLEVTA
jgi:hypothetical protein